MAGEILGTINCDGCGNQAGIKKLKNSDYLYLHCPKCGCDRRTGELVQSTWRAATQSPESVDNPQDAEDPEWSPSRETHSNKSGISGELLPESSPDYEDENLPITAKEVVTYAAVGLGIMGMLFRALKG